MRMFLFCIRSIPFMNFNIFKTCICFLFLPVSFLASAQSELYVYQNLSHIFYKNQKDSLKKAWVCPSVFNNKETQKLFKQSYESRSDFFAASLDARAYVYDQEIFAYLQDILKQLLSRKAEAQVPLVFIDRSAAINAYAFGDNVIVVNLGLLTYVQSREELALILAHELAHNQLEHTRMAMQDRAQWLTSSEYKESLSSVLDSKYERYSRLKNLVNNVRFDRSRHQRYNESEADSLAIQMLAENKIGFSADYFLRLDSTDLAYRTPLKQPIEAYFKAYQVPFDPVWVQVRTKGLSARAYKFSEVSELADSLKTHPECVERYEKFKHLSNLQSPTPLPDWLYNKANKMLLWNMFDDKRMTACIYRIFREKDRGNNDPWYDFMFHNAMAGLYYLDKQLSRSRGIGIVPKEMISTEYYQLQTALEQIPREQLQAIARQLGKGEFWKQLGRPELEMKNLLQFYALSDEASESKLKSDTQQFSKQFPSSLYREFTDYFLEK